MTEEITADVLILGAGGAGLLAALHALQRAPKLQVVIAVKGLLGQSGCTRMVQGGYNAVLDPADSLENHFLDTLRGGGWINHQELAWRLVEDAPRRIVELENRYGCLFDRNPDGSIHQKPFAGQSFDRTVHRGDLTGIEIMSNLRDAVLESSARVLEEHRGLDLLSDGERVGGALLMHVRSGRQLLVRARTTLIATGGAATMYKIASPSLEKSGDGMAMAWRAGAAFVDMEMLQFHPTGLVVGDSVATGGLLEEGLRGAGARLFNGRGERYMERYDPVRLERSTRDVVSRASFLEIAAGRGSPSGGVYLDATHLGEERLRAEFPGMVERCADHGFDLIHEHVEVSPSAHYQMGGIRIDTECRTSLDGLFAAGEDAGGVHGANRLGGNGVADSIVFGARAGDVLADAVVGRSWLSIAPPADSGFPGQRESPFALRRELNQLMWDHAGVVRRGDGLRQALRGLEALAARIGRARAATLPERNAALDAANLATVGALIARSALARTESRGAHYRTDFPERNDAAWLRNIILEPGQGSGGEPRSEPVAFTRRTPPEEAGKP